MAKNEIFENYIVSHDLGFYDSFNQYRNKIRF